MNRNFSRDRTVLFSATEKNKNRYSNHLKTLVYQRTINEIYKHDNSILVYNVVVRERKQVDKNGKQNESVHSYRLARISVILSEK